MRDWIRVHGIRVTARHGVLPHERELPQPFVVDLDVAVDLTFAVVSDEVADTIDYTELVRDVLVVLEGPPVALIERLAEQVATRVLRHPTAQAVRVVLHKPLAPVGVPLSDVGVSVTRRRERPVVIALGANLGRPARVLADAVRRLDTLEGIRMRAVSDLYDTDPVGGPHQPTYLNAVVVADTCLHPRTLLRGLQDVEAAFGRDRTLPVDGGPVRWGPRTLDLDLIQFGDPKLGTDVRCTDPDLTLPHPRAHERAFVLVPWLDVDPAAVLRVGDDVRTVADLIGAEHLDSPDLLPDGIRPGPAWTTVWNPLTGPTGGSGSGPGGGSNGDPDADPDVDWDSDTAGGSSW